MIATVMSSFLEYGEVANKNNEMSNYSSSNSFGAQLMSVPCSSASPSSCTPPAPLLDSKAAGTASAGGLFQPDSLKTDSSVLSLSSGNNKENRLRMRSYSELGDRLHPGSQACVGANSQVNSSRYKTEFCRPFEESGTCKYGNKCQFAHGMHELRSLNRHPKYKTELCRTFHTVGFCPYGPRCHFIHNAEERRGPPPLSAFNKAERPRLQHSFSFAGFPSFPSSGGPRDGPASVTPPPVFSADKQTEWLSSTFTLSSQELPCHLFGPRSPGHPPASEPSPTTPCFPQPTSKSPPSPPDSPSDQEGCPNGSESPLLDASRRLPIFSRLSVSDD